MTLVLVAWAPFVVACSDDEALPDARAVDAPTTDAPVQVDAPRPVDAAIDAPIDAPAACAGTVVLGACWYKGAVGASCTATCVAHGGVSAATVTVAGAASAGDRSHVAGCMAVAAALSARPFAAGVDNVNDPNDFGCVEEPDKNRTELISLAATVATSSHVMLARFCACAE